MDATPLKEVSAWAELYRPVWEARFDRMDDYLAPVDLIWAMWTDPEHFAAWYGPDGATIPVAKMDVRVGGTRLVCMEVQTPDGPRQMWFTGEYREVVENQRLVYTESMSDENGNVLSPQELGMPCGLTSEPVASAH